MIRKIALLMVLSPLAMACPKGTTEYEGNCAADLAPEKAVQTFIPSDEKPPRSGRPSYEAEGVHVDMPASAKAIPVLPPDDLSGKLPNGGVPR